MADHFVYSDKFRSKKQKVTHGAYKQHSPTELTNLMQVRQNQGKSANFDHYSICSAVFGHTQNMHIIYLLEALRIKKKDKPLSNE